MSAAHTPEAATPAAPISRISSSAAGRALPPPTPAAPPHSPRRESGADLPVSAAPDRLPAPSRPSVHRRARHWFGSRLSLVSVVRGGRGEIGSAWWRVGVERAQVGKLHRTANVGRRDDADHPALLIEHDRPAVRAAPHAWQ